MEEEYCNNFEVLKKRLDSKHLEKRLHIQKEHASDVYSRAGLSMFHPENSDLLVNVMGFLLKITGLAERAVRNSLDFRVEKHDIVSEKLHESFHGFTILQISDLHIECFVDQGEKLFKLLRSLKYDLCVITGDFRFLTHGDFNRCIKLVEHLARSASCPHGVVGVLGNHDFIEMVPGLEKAGITVLLNENIRITKGKGSLFLAGIDDPHFYGTFDLKKALHGVSEDDFVVFLSHSPEIYRKAAKMGVDYYLCGHTHGGQICLPGGIPVIINTHSPMKFASGEWNYRGMRGYTSRGTGSAGLPTRFFCPPEVTLHRFLAYEK